MWKITNNKLIKDVGEIQYQIIYKKGLEGLDGSWSAWKVESGLVVIGLVVDTKLETCIKTCNKDTL